MPAVAVVGMPLTLIITSSVDGVQGGLLMVQRNLFAPTPNPVTPVLGDAGEVIVPLPLTNV